MGFSYDPLWKMLIDRKMTKEQFRQELKISPGTIAKMGKGERVSMEIIERICKHFNCDIQDVVQYVKE